MQHQRSDLMPYERGRRVEAAILAAVLAEDWPWRIGEIAERLRLPAGAVRLGAATLQADGLLVSRGELLRATWAAVRGDELANWHKSTKRPAPRALVPGAAIALP
jgi:hypothetical protein